MKKQIRIVYVEDMPADAVLVNHELRKAGLRFRTKRVDSEDVFKRELDHNPPDLILSDHGLPSFDGFAALTIAKDKCPEVPFIFVTNSHGEETAVEMFERGATDYVLKTNLSKLVPAVQRALRETEERSKLKQREQALQDTEERFRIVVDGVKDCAIYMIDVEGRVATWNQGAERVEGYTAKEIIGKPLATFFPPEDVARKVPETALKKAQKEGRALNEGWRVRKDGSRFWSRGILTALRDAGGQLRGFAKVAHDLTRERRAEEEIQRLRSRLESRVIERTAQLEAANQELEGFSYSVSHDLRAPLRHILGYVDILQTGAKQTLDVGSRQHLQSIARSVTEMGQMIDALLQFSRLSRAKMHFKRVSLAALAQDVRRELRNEIKGRHIKWQIGHLPEMQGDLLMLRQAIVHLLSNAIKFTRTRRNVKIEIGAKKGARETIFFVRDNGVGFDMSYADKLFGVFQRFHRSTEFEGTGVGLAIVRRIIHKHGGRTWAEGKADGGATFYFSLPELTEEAT
ncbi:MAG TPA: ATP-binding protein [Candidatus Acidoferrum sp.]|nr:ATP-binding protein [Candidatus Acidoferrum sp.]